LFCCCCGVFRAVFVCSTTAIAVVFLVSLIPYVLTVQCLLLLIKLAAAM
jgi:hypothetical protein